MPFAWCYRRSNVTDWIISVGLPQRVLREPWFFTLGGLVIAGIVVVLASVALALRASRRFVRSIGQLGDVVSALRHEDQPVVRASLPSLDVISGILASACAELLAVRDDRQFLASAAEIGMWQWNVVEGTQFWSDRYREIFGFDRHVVPRREHFLDRIHPVDRRMADEMMARCLLQGNDYECEYRIIRADNGEQRWLRAKARIDKSESIKVLGVVADITAHKAAEHEIQESAARLKALVETVSDGVILIEGNGRMLLVNPACERLFGYPATEAVGNNVSMLMPSRERDEHDHYIDDFRRTGIPKIIGIGREVHGRRKDGTIFPLHLSMGEVRRDGEPLFVGILHDLTGRKAREREHENLRRRLMGAQETERLHLAHELHDEAGQGLAAAMLDLKRLEPLVEGSGAQLLHNLTTQLGQLGKNLHRIARELRPMAIDDLGLARALADYVGEWSERFDITVDYQCRNVDLDALPGDVCTVLYRVCQEALTNVAKHAVGTTVVSLVIDCANGLLQLTIEDNGCGFDLSHGAADLGLQTTGGLGLAGMRERLALIGGELEIESSAGLGTTIFVRIALERMEIDA